LSGKLLAFFPGKFQPPHIGHVLTISRMLEKYNVIIGISPDEPRIVSQEYVEKTFKDIFGSRVSYFIFYKVLTSYSDISSFPKFDILISGNDKVLEWGERINLKSVKIKRSECIGGSGTELRKIYGARKNEI